MSFSRFSVMAAAGLGLGAGLGFASAGLSSSVWARESGSKPNEGSGLASICVRAIASLIYIAAIMVANDPTKKKDVLIFNLLL